MSGQDRATRRVEWATYVSTPTAATRSRRLAPALAWASAWLAFVGLLLPAPCLSQHVKLQRYGKSQGLVNQNPMCLLRDREEYLWVCTENGLYRYDGDRFTRFSEADGLDNTRVYSAVLDASGRLWLATSSDLYVGEHGRFQAVRPQGRALTFAAEARLRLLTDGRIAAVLQRRVVAVREVSPGLWHADALFSDQLLAQVPDLARAVNLNQEEDGRLWLGCGSAICSVRDDEVRRWGPLEGVPGDQWAGFLRDRAGRLWARGRNSVLMLPKEGERFLAQSVPHVALRNLNGASVLAESPYGSIVLRTDHGLARWEEGRWSFDQEGSLWLAMDGTGLARWIGFGKFESWTRVQGLNDDVIWGIRRRYEGTLTIGTRSGCSELDTRASVARPCRLDGLPLGDIGVMSVAPDGRLWIGMRSGELLMVAPGTRKARLVARLPRFSALLIDGRQRLWIPTRSGVFVLQPGEALPRLVSEEREFLDVAEDAQGGIWVGGTDGLRRYADGRWTSATLADRRAGPGFFSIAIGPDGILWAASQSRGLLMARIAGGVLLDPEWVADPVVADASPVFVRLDAQQRVWVGTDYGVLVNDPKTPGTPWLRLTESDGLIWNDIDGGSFLADSDGSVWIGTSGGLIHVVSPSRALSRMPLQLRLQGARYAGQAIATSGLPRLPRSTSAALDLDLVSFDFSRSIDSLFRYRIVGVDADWFESRSPHVHYPALEPGNYRFEAMLVDPDRRQSSDIVAFEFNIQPPWWRTKWLKVACTLLGIVLLAGVWRWQLRRIAARHAQVQARAREHNLLLERASRDGLTGLWNRSAILDLLTQTIAQQSAGRPLALAVLDVDHFKRVNDTLGHAMGDAVLRILAQRLSSRLRQADLLGRYGGEELLLVMPDLPYDNLPPAVERLREAVSGEPFDLPSAPSPLSVTISIGVAWFGVARHGERKADDDAQQLFERADAALYEAKNGGRNRVVCALPPGSGLGRFPPEKTTA